MACAAGDGRTAGCAPSRVGGILTDQGERLQGASRAVLEIAMRGEESLAGEWARVDEAGCTDLAVGEIGGGGGHEILWFLV